VLGVAAPVSTHRIQRCLLWILEIRFMRGFFQEICFGRPFLTKVLAEEPPWLGAPRLRFDLRPLLIQPFGRNGDRRAQGLRK
jgi:hypothetical protein